MPRAPKPCGRTGCPEWVTGTTYCDEHRRERIRLARRSPTSRAADKTAERTRRRRAVAHWVNINGWVCPGYRRDPHPSRDLTAAHTHAVVHGGADSPITVLCRSCNSRMGTTD